MKKISKNYVIIIIVILLTIISSFFLRINNQAKKYNSSNGSITVYNNAYQENYETDSIELILKEAFNAYVLLDPDNKDLKKSISTLKENGNMVSAYVSIGTGETYRDDFELLKPFLTEKPWSQWNDEYFINVITPDLISIMKKRIDVVAELGFTWIEFDNMDWAFDDVLRDAHDLTVTEKEAIDYYNELCNYVHSLDLKCMAKNTTINAAVFDGVTYESSSEERNWWNTTELVDFLDKKKLGIIVHYNEVDPQEVYNFYIDIYGENLSIIVESRVLKRYVHF